MNISDIANAIVALTSITAIVLGISTSWYQNRQTRRLLGIKILRDFEEKFFWSEKSLRLRYSVCKHYKTKGLNADDAPDSWRLADELGALCFYINKGYIDEEAAWSLVYFWLDHYWYLLRSYANNLKIAQGGVDYLSDFREAHDLLTRFGKRKHDLPEEEHRWSTDKIEAFLDEEIAETLSAHLSMHSEQNTAEPFVPVSVRSRHRPPLAAER